MATERIEFFGNQTDNIGGGYLINLFYIDSVLPGDEPARLNQGLYGFPLALDRTSIQLNKIQIDLKSKMVVKDGAEQWEYRLSAEIPRNDLEKLRVLYNVTRRRFFCAYFTFQSSNIPGLNQQRVIGWTDNPCSFEFEEIHGQKMNDFNHYRFEISCVMPKPATYITF